MSSYKTRHGSSEESQSEPENERITLEYSMVLDEEKICFLMLRKEGKIWHGYSKIVNEAPHAEGVYQGEFFGKIVHAHTTTEETLKALKNLLQVQVVKKRQKIDNLEGELEQAIRTIEGEEKSS